MDKARENVLKFTHALCGIPSSSSDKEANRACLDYIKDILKDTKWNIREFQKHPSSSPFLYISRDNKVLHSKVLHLCHVDVVPCSEYCCTEGQDGILRGRGVSDMKGPVSCILQILLEINPEVCDVACVVVTDEEIGGIDGAKYAFLDQNGPKISCDVCLIADGGDGFKLVTHEKGVLRFRLSAKSGKAAHSAYPWNGENAIQSVMQDLQRLLNCSDSKGRLIFNNSSYPKHIDSLSFENWHTTLVPTMIQGGTAVNQVPGTADVIVDIRYTEMWQISDLKSNIEKHVKNCQIAYIFEQPMLISDPHSIYMQEAKKTMEDTLGTQVSLSRGHGTSDGHWAPHFTVIMFKPIGGGLHQDDEWVNLESLLIHYTITKKLTLLWA